MDGNAVWGCLGSSSEPFSEDAVTIIPNSQPIDGAKYDRRFV